MKGLDGGSRPPPHPKNCTHISAIVNILTTTMVSVCTAVELVRGIVPAGAACCRVLALGDEASLVLN